MIFYPIMTLRDAGVTDIIVTLGEHGCEQIFELLGDGSELGVRITYVYQGAPKGIAHAIYTAKNEIGDEPFIVHLGDNLFCEGLEFQVKCFKEKKTPMILVKRMPWAKAKNYGVAYFNEFDEVSDLVEKPQRETSPFEWVVVGAYFLDNTFFEAFELILPSERGEYEIMDALRLMDLSWMGYGGQWYDCGTFEDLHQAATWRRSQVCGSA